MSRRVWLTDDIADAAAAVFEPQDDVTVDRTGTPDPAELIERIGSYDAVIVRSPTKITAEVITAGAPRLRVVGRAGVGVDNIDVEAATRAGVLVVNAPGGNTVSTAEHTMALMLALARHVPRAHASLVGGAWERSRLRGVELAGATLGVVGLGRVGRAVAQRARAFGMHVIGCDPVFDADAIRALGVEPVAFDALVERADWITVHVPLTDATRGLIGEAELARVRPGVRIVNCARGGVVDEAALARALVDGRVAGAALDVYAVEPLPADSPLRAVSDRCVLTPHLGAATRQAQVRVAVEAAEAVRRALGGEVPESAVNRPAPRS